MSQSAFGFTHKIVWHPGHFVRAQREIRELLAKHRSVCGFDMCYVQI